MTYTSTDKGYIIILTRGEKLIETLTSFCQKENINLGVFNGIGACVDPELGYYNLEIKEYKWQIIEKEVEIVSLTGNVSLVHNSPFLHIHTVVSDDSFDTYGGHLKEAKVGATCEIFLRILDGKIVRNFDSEVGLKLLNCDQTF